MRDNGCRESGERGYAIGMSKAPPPPRAILPGRMDDCRDVESRMRAATERRSCAGCKRVLKAPQRCGSGVCVCGQRSCAHTRPTGRLGRGGWMLHHGTRGVIRMGRRSSKRDARGGWDSRTGCADPTRLRIGGATGCGILNGIMPLGVTSYGGSAFFMGACHDGAGRRQEAPGRGQHKRVCHVGVRS